MGERTLNRHYCMNSRGLDSCSTGWILGIAMCLGFKRAMCVICVAMAWIMATASVSWSLELPAQPFSNLGSEEFRKRESAQAELLAWSRERPEVAKDELFRQSRVADNPEVRERCLAVLRELVNDEYSKEGEGYLGIQMQQANEIVKIPGDAKPRMAIRVIQVMPESAAELAGLQVNDLIVGLGDDKWHEGLAYDLLRERIRQLRPETRVMLKVLRNGRMMEIAVKLGRRPLQADMMFFDPRQVDLGAAERAAKDSYFRRWLERRKLPK